jgi:eukaryotic-like serine/threonine-protein kinase
VVGGLKPEDPRQIGPYRLVGQLGSGGMGRVFLGVSAGGRPVAVKVVRAELAADQEFRVRFRREVAAARRVSGLFTALVVGADVDGPVPWLATAYVAGPSLSQAVSDDGPMPAQPALALAAGLAEGLSGIHAAGVVHCDLKPSNVLLSPDGPRVIDFGISRAAGAASAPGAGWVIGSPGFMSPEQAMGEEVGPPSDIFSLGAVLTFAATGGGPFGHGSRPELAYRLVYRPPNLGLVPAELRPLVERCLAKDPARRPTADEVLASAAQPAAGWLPEAILGAFVPAGLPSQPSGPGEPSGQGELSGPSRPRRWWRPLVAAGVTVGVLAASVAVSSALSGGTRHSSAGPVVPRAAATPASSSSVPVLPATYPASARSSSAPGLKPAIIPDVDTITSPGPPASRRPSATPSASKRPPASPSPSPTATASPAPSPPPSTAPPAPVPVPQITSVGTYQQGVWVYFDVHYADPGNDAQGFGFTGVNGSRWADESYPFSSPGRGIAGPDSIAYPLDLECGTPLQHTAEIEAWIYDTAGESSQPVTIQLACPASTQPSQTPGAGPSAAAVVPV